MTHIIIYNYFFLASFTSGSKLFMGVVIISMSDQSCSRISIMDPHTVPKVTSNLSAVWPFRTQIDHEVLVVRLTRSNGKSVYGFSSCRSTRTTSPSSSLRSDNEIVVLYNKFSSAISEIDAIFPNKFFSHCKTSTVSHILTKFFCSRDSQKTTSCSLVVVILKSGVPGEISSPSSTNTSPISPVIGASIVSFPAWAEASVKDTWAWSILFHKEARLVCFVFNVVSYAFFADSSANWADSIALLVHISVLSFPISADMFASLSWARTISRCSSSKTICFCNDSCHCV